MKISVVTISFNQARYLPACIASVAGQEGPWEHIIVDPGSSDGSREIIAQHREQFAHAVLEPDNGPADGLNKGFALASGEIFYYLNSDDVVLPGAFAAARAEFEAHPGSDVIFGNGCLLDAGGAKGRKVRSSPFLTRYAYLSGGAMVLQQATFFRREIFKKAGGFNVKNRSCWDGELIADMASAGGRFRHVNCDWGGFRIHGESISGCGLETVELRYRAERERMFQDAYGRARHAGDRVSGYVIGSVNALGKLVNSALR